ncbi:MAG: hypothetical protein GC179_21750 [Anaerolineaceae bacterium]|nr:hypothetical protein [Anaerolineaceae bacterium]
MQRKLMNGVLFTAILELLLVAASRLLVLHHIRMGGDEIWSVWQTLGTPGQIMQWTPFDWTAGYYLTLGFWRGWVGMLPFALRMLSFLVFLIGCAALYRVARRFGGERAALLAIPAYGALGYTGVLGTEVRGYALLLGLLPLALWFLLRFYTHPNWRRALPLVVSLAVMPYISLTGFVVFGMVGLFALVIYQRRVGRAWLVAAVIGLSALPVVLEKWSLMRTRGTNIQAVASTTTLEAFQHLFQDYLGRGWALWAVLLIAATIILLPRLRSSRPVLALFIWIVGGVGLMYILNPVLGFFFARYSWWVMIGIALWAALGLARLPEFVAVIAAVILLALNFIATPLNDQSSALGENLEWLRDHIQPGDVLVIDPLNNCGGSYEWDYAIRAYFPEGLAVVNDPTGYRRVWYARSDGNHSDALVQQITTQRLPDRFVGPATCLIRLYQGPPDEKGVLFENGMRFHGADVLDADGRIWLAPTVRHEGESITLRLWWSVDAPVKLDYSVGTYVLADELVAQSDGAPQLIFPENAPRETSRWKRDQLYIEERTLKLPDQMSSGESIYNLDLAVYDWQSNQRVTAAGEDENHLLRLRPIFVKAW